MLFLTERGLELFSWAYGDVLHSWACQGAIEDHLSVLGVKREAREYRAHLTLMRLKSRKHLSRLQDWFKRQLQVSGMSFPVNHFHLYQSVLKPEGAEYRVLETFPLGNPPLP